MIKNSMLIDFREWECTKFPQWLQKTYRIRGSDFCKHQWYGTFFNSQPHCNDKVLPSISFYDAVDSTKPICNIDMNKMDTEEEFYDQCSELVTKSNTFTGTEIVS